MKTLPLANTGVNVSALGLGTMYFGTKVDEATSFDLLDIYCSAGGNFLDTANKYASWVPGFSGGESEELLGKWMRARRNRAQLFLATKVGLPMPGVEKGLRAAQIITECEKSLRRLGSYVIDLYYAHADDRDTPLEETAEAFDHLVATGKVRFLGASNYLAWRLHEARLLCARNGWAKFICVQTRYSFLQPDPWVPQEFAAQIPASPELLDYCAAHGLRVIAYSPLLGGAYTRPDRALHSSYCSPANDKKLAAISRVAQERGITVNQAVLSWMVHGKNAVIPLITGSTPTQLRENLDALKAIVTEAEISGAI
jgi:aryl-alcohol dehydrogenase-like predicted oxidoreductase